MIQTILQTNPYVSGLIVGGLLVLAMRFTPWMVTGLVAFLISTVAFVAWTGGIPALEGFGQQALQQINAHGAFAFGALAGLVIASAALHRGRPRRTEIA